MTDLKKRHGKGGRCQRDHHRNHEVIHSPKGRLGVHLAERVFRRWAPVVRPVRIIGAMRDISTTEAKVRLAELLRAVDHGETVVITRQGQAIAHLVPARRQDREARELSVESFRKRRRQWRRVRMTSEGIVAAIHEGRRRVPTVRARLLLPAILGILPAVAPLSPAAGEERSAFFGDLHVHTAYSFDAFSFATRTTPDDAYRFAAGEAIRHPSGNEIQLDRPLDFYAVTEHAAYLGVPRALADPSHPLTDDPEVKRYVDATTVKARGGYLPGASEFVARHDGPEVLRTAWREIVDAAERHYRPVTLTTFIGYEYTPSRDGGNLHRNVIFSGGAVPEIPFSRLDSANPEDLWTWMDCLRDRGIEALAIPHNSNGSDGWMFQTETFARGPLDADYATKRMRNERVVEITQVKGTSETHPFLSPNDEWAQVGDP